MASLGDLLGSFLQSTMPNSGESRVGNILQDLQSSLENLPGVQAGQDSSIFGRIMDTAKSALGSAAQNPAQAAGLGAVLGSVLGGGGGPSPAPSRGAPWRCWRAWPTRH